MPDTTAKVFTVALLLFLVLGVTFSGGRYWLDPVEARVYWIEETWWGLREEMTELRWLEPDQTWGPCWAARSDLGEWYCFVHENDWPSDW